jgi:hypothetical protein
LQRYWTLKIVLQGMSPCGTFSLRACGSRNFVLRGVIPQQTFTCQEWEPIKAWSTLIPSKTSKYIGSSVMSTCSDVCMLGCTWAECVHEIGVYLYCEVSISSTSFSWPTILPGASARPPHPPSQLTFHSLETHALGLWDQCSSIFPGWIATEMVNSLNLGESCFLPIFSFASCLLINLSLFWNCYTLLNTKTHTILINQILGVNHEIKRCRMYWSRSPPMPQPVT